MTTELWKDIKGYEGIYQVSSLGNIRRIIPFQSNKKKIRNLNLFHTPSGYFRRALWKDGVKTNYQVHRLVAEVFIPNDNPNKIWVNHINHIRDDNRVENLEWITPSMNVRHGYEHLSYGDVIDYTINKVFLILERNGHKIEKPDEINRQAFQDGIRRYKN